MQTYFKYKFCLVHGNVNEKLFDNFGSSELWANTTLGQFVITFVGYIASAIGKLIDWFWGWVVIIAIVALLINCTREAWVKVQIWMYCLLSGTWPMEAKQL